MMRLLDTALSLGCAEELVELENSVFGAEYQYTVEELEPWLLSASYFCYAAQAGSGTVGTASACVVQAASADAMASGCVGELELQLCNAGAQGSVEVYFASLIPELCTDSLCECGCVRSGLAVVVRW